MNICPIPKSSLAARGGNQVMVKDMENGFRGELADGGRALILACEQCPQPSQANLSPYFSHCMSLSFFPDHPQLLSALTFSRAM